METVEKAPLGKTLLLGTLASICISLILVLVFAFCLRFFGLGEGGIFVVVEIIKGASIFGGVFWTLRKHHHMGFISGMLIGLCFTVCSFVLFGILDGFRFDIDLTLWSNILFGAIIGGICGVIAVNIKK